MLVVTALKLGYPALLIVLVKADDPSIHCETVVVPQRRIGRAAQVRLVDARAAIRQRALLAGSLVARSVLAEAVIAASAVLLHPVLGRVEAVGAR